MRKLPILATMAILALGLAGCGEMVEIPPAFKGKVLTKNGFAPETIASSKFRLAPCWAYCDKLVLTYTGDKGMKEEFQLFMPKDQLNMKFDVRFTLAVRPEEKSINSIFARMTYTVDDHGFNVIRMSKIYETYGKPAMREVVRTTMANYSINEVASSRERINAELTKAVHAALASTPLTIRQFSIADVQFPTVITEQKEKAAQRRIQIDEQEAKKQIALIEIQTEIEKVKLNRVVRRERAEAVKEENGIYAASVTPKYLEYRRLEVLEEMAKNGNAVFIPMEALGTVGLSQRVFTKK